MREKRDWVMDSSIETSRPGDTLTPKPNLGPKPRLAPKPFSLQKNSTIRSIHAPRTVTTTSKSTSNQSGTAEAKGVPKVTLPSTAQTPPQQTTTPDSKPSTVSLHIKDEPKRSNESKESPRRENTPNSSVAPGKSDPAPQTKGVPIVTLPSTAHKPPQQTTTPDSKPSPVTERVKDEPKTTSENKESPRREDTPDSTVAPGKTDPAPQTTPPKETPKSDAVQKENVLHTNHKAPAVPVSNLEQKDLKNEEEKTSVIQKPEESGNDSPSTANPTYQWGGTRRRLSTKLTSKFESGGLPVSPQPTITVSTTYNKDNINKLVPTAPEKSQTTPEPSNRESSDGGLLDYSGGGSIKRRISQLFDTSQNPEAVTKKEEPEIITGSGGVKERIKNWVMETSSEAPKPQVGPRTRTRSCDSPTSPEKTPNLATVQLLAADTPSTQAVAPSPKDSPVKQPTETPMETSKEDEVEKPLEKTTDMPEEHEQNKLVEDEVQLPNHRLSTDQAATDEGDSGSSESPQRALKRNNKKRRSVRFGIVETDDGGPPLILGSPSDSSSEEEEAPGDKGEANTSVSVPVYRRVGILLNKDNEIQKKEEEQQKHLESEKRLKAEENEQVRLKLEEERKKREEKEEREKENARQREELRRREEEKQREEERKRERLKKEEVERQKKEEQERERLKEEERKRKVKLMQQKQREEERERMMQKEEQLRKDQEEREKERLREEERQREERERQRMKEVEESSIHRLEGKLREGEISLEKQKEEKLEKESVNKTESLKGEDEEMGREKELELMRQRQKEEERERARQIEERLRQEEMERERLRKEAEEREREIQRRLEEEERMRARQRQEEEEERRRRELEIEMQQEKEEEMERMRQIEKQREEARREEERKKQLEKERVEELERKMQEELERKQAKELEEKLRMEEEERDEQQRLVSQQEAAKEEFNLISFDSEDVPQKSETPLSPQSQIEIVYDDFSVKNPQMEVEFDDFSVKPKRWGSQAKAETRPLQSWRAEPVDKEQVEVLVPVNVHPQENKAPERVAKPDSPEPTAAMESPEEEEEEKEEEEEEKKPVEEQLNSVDLEEDVEEEEEESEDEVEDEAEEEDTQEAQVNSYCINAEDKDTDALIDSEPDQQNGFCEQTTATDSPKPVPDAVPEVSSQDVDTTDSHREPDFAPFPESSTPLLDTSAQRSKANLGRRRSRTRPSRSLRLAQAKSPNWRVHDSTDEKEVSSKEEDSDPEEKQPKLSIVSSPSPTSQRVPTVPGLNPAALIAQLKRRTAGGGVGRGDFKEEVKQREEKESQHEEVTLSPSQLPRSPRPAAHLAGAALVLPPLGSTDGGAVSSPAWLKELKSKKRLSQYDSEA